MRKTPDIVYEEDAPGIKRYNPVGAGNFQSTWSDADPDWSVSATPAPRVGTMYHQGQIVWAYSFIAKQWFEAIVTAHESQFTINLFSETYKIVRGNGCDGNFAASAVRLTRPNNIYEKPA